LETFKSFERDLYRVNADTFNAFSIRLFQFQALHNPVYREYLGYLGITPNTIEHYRDIPFLPISFFKSHKVQTGSWKDEGVFFSSGTTGAVPSRHLVMDKVFYLRNTVEIFARHFGPLSDFHVLALLPSYLEREGSSLIAMAENFIRLSGSPQSGFYLNNQNELISKLKTLHGGPRKVLLLGVTFALLDLAENFEIDLGHCMVMETGGMKGRRPEKTRQEVHEYLMGRLNLDKVYSEYGMTELFSQAYSAGNGLFQAPAWMKVILRDPEDPFEYSEATKQGAINIIDLANFHSCAFIETQDLGQLGKNGYFEVLGRMDNADIRGCNLLVG
jgi:phenylacetate-coenzyme A ligase PaaK-like adenylate-forming protein